MRGERSWRLAVREPRSPTAPASPLLVLLHGYGSDEADLMGLADSLDPRLRVVGVRAPLQLDMGGYAWFPLDITPVGIAVDHEAAAAALGRLQGLVTRLQTEGGHRGEDTLLLGFSQGGAMALGLMLATPHAVAGVAFLSGLWRPSIAPQAAPAGVRGKPVLQTHGTQDPLIAIDRARRTRQLLRGMGLDLTYREYPMGHQIDADCLGDVAAWIRDRVGAGDSGTAPGAR